jgi:hypothetical protein
MCTMPKTESAKALAGITALAKVQVSISIYHIPRTDCPYETDTFFFIVSVHEGFRVLRS